VTTVHSIEKHKTNHTKQNCHFSKADTFCFDLPVALVTDVCCVWKINFLRRFACDVHILFSLLDIFLETSREMSEMGEEIEFAEPQDVNVKAPQNIE
jgi:hypothetical protein